MRARNAALALLASGSLACQDAPPEMKGCAKDTDCKGARICRSGRCEDPAAELPSAAPSVSSTGSAESAWTRMEVLPFNPNALAADMPFEGTMAAGAAFRDRFGDNTVILSHNDKPVPGHALTRLRAYHWIRDTLGTRLVR